MFTMAKLYDGSTYLGDHLTANDYYAEKESVTGRWVGQAAERLGLAGRDISAADEPFERLRCNLHPLTGRRLTSRTSGRRIAFLDFQCSAPKSVSLLAVTFGDERLRQAHHEAVSFAFAELERFAARRVRGGEAAWSEQVAVTGNLCAARFEHDASRALDAHLHTHLVTANATFDAKADKWFALTEREMLSAVRYAGKVYQNELAHRVLAAGYQIEAARNDRGSIEGFEIVGVTPADRAVASKRRAQIEREIASFEKKHGRAPTTKEIHGIATRTRSRKLVEITTAEVRRKQRDDFSLERLQALESLVTSARSAGPAAAAPDGEQNALRQARDHLFERASVQRGHEIIAEALNQSLGTVSLETLKEKLSAGHASDCVSLKDGPDCLRSDYATRAGLQQELGAIHFVNAGRNLCTPLCWTAFQPDRRLSADQRNAVQTLLESTDRVCALRGIAGTGKTFTLQEVRRGIVVSGGTVIACAPTTSAAGVLRADGFANATTLADLLKNAESLHGPKLHGATLIVDEAGIASARQGAELCELVRRHDGRLILVGDSRQHSGVEAGDFLALLERHSCLQTCELTDIRRQTAHEYRAAVKLMAQGRARAGVEAVDRLGWLKETGADYIQQAADHYVTSLAEKRDVILVAPTWEEINRLTEVVRTSLKKRGRLGHGETVSVAEPLSWTKVQATKAANYRPGYLMTLHSALPEAGLRAGETVEVITAKRSRLLVRCADNRETTVAPVRQSAKWTVSAPRTVELAPGDRVLIRQNHRSAGLVNGAVLTLESRKPSGAWRAHDGAGVEKEIPPDFRAFTHGYAVTSHKSQGRTCDEVIVCAARLDAKAAYVAFSRARQRATGYTPDKAALFAALPDSNRPRRAALDLWTPDRRRRLRWACEVIARVREIFSSLTPRPERVVVAEPKVQNTPSIKPVVPKNPVEPSDHHNTPAIRSAEQPRMRISL
jgi:conjugative relaxase-like TrwC/TraI family protein